MNKKIKVCHFAHLLNGKADGVYKHISLITKYTNKNVFEHHFCYPGNLENEILSKSSFESVNILKKLNTKDLLLNAYFFIEIWRKNNFDIVHTHSIKTYLIACIANSFLRKKVIYNYHGHFIDNMFYSSSQKNIIKVLHYLFCKFSLVSIAIAPSSVSKIRLMKETKHFPEIFVYWNGGEIQTANKNRSTTIIKTLRSDSNFKLVFIGRLAKEKRIDRALRIVKEISDKQLISFYIVGFGEEERKLKSLVKELRIEKIVKFIGYLENPQQYLENFDLLILTSDYEGTPQVLWEAMAEAVPIISSDVDGCSEIICSTGCGLIYNGELRDARGKIVSLMKNKKELVSMGVRGQDAIRQKYNLISFGQRIGNIYNSLLNRQVGL